MRRPAAGDEQRAEEAALVAAARDGDLEAFNRLILRYRQQVYNLAYHFLHDPAAADDATQEAFIAAYRSLKRFRGGSFRAWLMRIVANAARDELRRRKRRPTVSWEAFGELDEEANPYLVDEAEGIEARTERHALRLALERALAELPERQRALILLIDHWGFSYEEAAQALGLRLGTVKSGLARARSKMRRYLQSAGELLPLRYRLEEGERR